MWYWVTTLGVSNGQRRAVVGTAAACRLTTNMTAVSVRKVLSVNSAGEPFATPPITTPFRPSKAVRSTDSAVSAGRYSSAVRGQPVGRILLDVERLRHHRPAARQRDDARVGQGGVVPGLARTVIASPNRHHDQQSRRLLPPEPLQSARRGFGPLRPLAVGILVSTNQHDFGEQPAVVGPVVRTAHRRVHPRRRPHPSSQYGKDGKHAGPLEGQLNLILTRLVEAVGKETAVRR